MNEHRPSDLRCAICGNPRSAHGELGGLVGRHSFIPAEPPSSKPLVDRLRAWNGNSFGPYASPVPDLLEAADAIERLMRERDEAREEAEQHLNVARNFNTGWSNEQKDNQRLRAALEEIARDEPGAVCTVGCNELAREALRPADETAAVPPGEDGPQHLHQKR